MMPLAWDAAIGIKTVNQFSNIFRWLPTLCFSHDLPAAMRVTHTACAVLVLLAVCTGVGPGRWGLPRASALAAAGETVGSASGAGDASDRHGVGEADEESEEPEDFALLPDEELAREWSTDDGVALSEKVRTLREAVTAASVVISVKLVGLQPGRTSGAGVDVDALRRHLDSLKGQLEQLHVLSTDGGSGDGDGSDSGGHDLLVKRQFSFVVSHASKCV